MPTYDPRLGENIPDPVDTGATAAPDGALPDQALLIGGEDVDAQLIRALGADNFRGEWRLTIFDRKVYNAITEAVLLLTEIRDLLQKGS